jgi:hypothetical protein
MDILDPNTLASDSGVAERPRPRKSPSRRGGGNSPLPDLVEIENMDQSPPDGMKPVDHSYMTATCASVIQMQILKLLAMGHSEADVSSMICWELLAILRRDLDAKFSEEFDGWIRNKSVEGELRRTINRVIINIHKDFNDDDVFIELEMILIKVLAFGYLCNRLRPFARSVAHRTATVFLRRRNRCRTVPLPEGGLEVASPDLGANPTTIDQAELVATMLSRLKGLQRDAMHAIFVLNLSYEAAAKLLESPAGSVKSAVHEGLKKLRTIYGDQAGGTPPAIGS